MHYVYISHTFLIYVNTFRIYFAYISIYFNTFPPRIPIWRGLAWGCRGLAWLGYVWSGQTYPSQARPPRPQARPCHIPRPATQGLPRITPGFPPRFPPGFPRDFPQDFPQESPRISPRIPRISLRRPTPSWAPHPRKVWGHHLQHMAPFGATTGGFCMVFQRATLIFSTPEPILGASGLGLGLGRPASPLGAQSGGPKNIIL